jgi:hypothetical protein
MGDVAHVVELTRSRWGLVLGWRAFGSIGVKRGGASTSWNRFTMASMYAACDNEIVLNGLLR